MREIKFRAYSDASGNMTEWDVLKILHATTFIGVKSSTFHLMQFTGLKDKNGRDVYEGDIVAAEDGKLSSIQWEAPQYIIRHHPEGGSDFLAGKKLKFKVIGNIHENPELLHGH